jgi:hypothetical protein
MTSTPAFDGPARAAFAALYPETPGIIRHNLAEHPLFTLEALVELSQRLDPANVEYNRADLPIGIAAEDVPSNGLSIADTIRSIRENGSWMVLKFVEQDSTYKALLDAVLDELVPVVGPTTGEMLTRQAFIFISSPNSVTPFHFDPEHNILLQLQGQKVMTQFPAADRDIVPIIEHERYHVGGHRNLPWNEAFAQRGTDFALKAGDAVYVPVKAPHWVKNGPELSVSFSITWRSAWSYAEEDAHALNDLLRRKGIMPNAPGRYPVQNRAKSFAWRALRKSGLV